MKNIIIIALLALLAVPQAIYAQQQAQTREESTQRANNVTNDSSKRFSIGVQVGTDMGSAITVPFSYIPSTFNPYPEINLSIGARFSYAIEQRWSVHTEVTYKRVVMRADARVDDQKFQMDDQMQFFSGSAEMLTDFTMIEVPLYAKWSINKNHKSYLILGGYYAHYLSPKFVTTAFNGYVGGVPDEVAGTITPDDPMVMDFSEYLGSSDFGILFGFERRIWDKANIGLRFSMGFKDIFRADAAFFDYAMWQMRGTIVLEYDLFTP